MWAVQSQRPVPEVAEDIVYFRMANEFGFPPELVDRMTEERVESLLFIKSKLDEKREKEMKQPLPLPRY